MTAPTKEIDLVSRLFRVEETDSPRDGTLHDHHTDTICGRSADGLVLSWPWTAIPVLAGGLPDRAHQVFGGGLVVNADGVGLECDMTRWCGGSALVIGVQDPQGKTHYAGIEVSLTSHRTPGRVRIIGRFGGLGQQLLNPESLKPKLRPDTLTFAPGFSEEILNAWVEVGVLHATWLDRVHLCPRCRALPSFRTGCQCCGSARLTTDQLIHHFACAHVGLVADFEADGGLICPKCRTRHLVVGSDYEYCTGPYRCLDCHWTAGELEQVAQCLRCELRFPGHQAHQQDLTGYCANRLDAQALLAAPGPVSDPSCVVSAR